MHCFHIYNLKIDTVLVTYLISGKMGIYLHEIHVTFL